MKGHKAHHHAHKAKGGSTHGHGTHGHTHNPMMTAAKVHKAKGGKVMKKADGGLATSIPSPQDDNAAANAFVNERASQLRGMVGKAKGGKVDKADMAQDKKMIAAAVHKHEQHDHPGKPLTKLRKGGKAGC